MAPTPAGDWIIYMSDKGENRGSMRLQGADWWAVRADGEGTKRLTAMNLREPQNPELFEKPITAITAALSPKGDFMLGDVQDSLVRQTGYSMLVRFTCR